jgi:hypothetical protein
MPKESFQRYIFFAMLCDVGCSLSLTIKVERVHDSCQIGLLSDVSRLGRFVHSDPNILHKLS